MDLRQQLGVETPEHVEVHLELVGVGSRTAAAFFDTVLLNLGVILIVVVARTIGTRLSGAVEGWLMAALVLLYYFAVLGYFVLFEALNGGRTPGKQALGIRVVMATGHPVTPTAAVVRNVVRLLDCYFPLLPVLPGLLFVFLQRRNQRPGDLAAGAGGGRGRPRGRGPGPRGGGAAGGGRGGGARGPPGGGGRPRRRLVGRTGADVRRRSPRHRIPRATRQRGAQRLVPGAGGASHTRAPLRAAGFPFRSRPVVASGGGRRTAVRRPGGRGLRDDPRAPAARRGGDVSRNGGARRAGGRAPGPRDRLRAEPGGRAAGDRFRHHRQQRAHRLLDVRRGPRGRDAHGVGPGNERAAARDGLRVVREPPRRRLPRDLHRGARRARAVGDLHRRRRGVPDRGGADRPRRPDAPGRARGGGADRGTDAGRRGFAARGCWNDRRPAVGQRRPRRPQVRRQRYERRAARALSEERVGGLHRSHFRGILSE